MNVIKNTKKILNKENFITTYELTLVVASAIACAYCWMIEARTQVIPRTAGVIVLSYGVVILFKHFYTKKK